MKNREKRRYHEEVPLGICEGVLSGREIDVAQRGIDIEGRLKEAHDGFIIERRPNGCPWRRLVHVRSIE